ncbi:hypothetical protein IMCC3317_10160 [Kordia antarctica]|uniref:Uncharacterized protein n=1 Tax=Kordia antarctica TaxID=1218801 RepID=A0A7L4ZGM9_9FLAO|nr:hypothetical protein [Kordia antarctica]QHI35670.1 hypothetical protein IMCC3317_10160 [Kordia antarctica]
MKQICYLFFILISISAKAQLVYNTDFNEDVLHAASESNQALFERLQHGKLGSILLSKHAVSYAIKKNGLHATIVGIITNEKGTIVYESNRSEGVLFPGDMLFPGDIIFPNDILDTLAHGTYIIDFKVILNRNQYEKIKLKKKSKTLLQFNVK